MDPFIVGGILELGKSLIGKLIRNPEDKAKAELDLLLMHQTGELKELETRMSAILAEANSADPWTSRARPSFLYVFYFIILSMVFIAPVIGVFAPDQMDVYFTNVGRGFAAIPDALWATFTAGYLGYAGFRTMEKRKGVAR
jgi:hypothetical protein